MNRHELGRLGFYARTLVPQRDKPTELEGPIPWLRIEDFEGKYLSRSRTGQGVTASTVAAMNLRVFPEGTVVTSCSCTMGATAIAKNPLITNQTFIGLVPDRDRLSSDYLFWLMQGHSEELQAQATGAIQQYLSQDDFKSLRLWIPDLDRQRRIAEFLDRETAQIDELIAKQEQLISTLAERLDSRWSELFVGLERTHGLTPVRRLIRSIVDGPFGSSLTSAHYVEEGHRVIRLGNLGTWAFKDTDKAYIDAEYAITLSSHAVGPGDVLVAGLGDEKMPLGRACVAPDDLGPAIVKADCYRVRPARGVDSDYLAWALSAPPARDQFQLLSRGTTRSRLNTTVVREARVPLPSHADQRRISREFAALVANHERLIATADRAKSLLAERRQALISASVTGQLEVL